LKYILDTHALLWITSDSDRLTSKAKSIYLDDKNEIWLSKASVWEMAIKISLKKLQIKNNIENFINDHVVGNGIKILDITLEQIYKLETLPFHHRDPFDRLIISQSMTEGIPVISSDHKFDKYNVNRIWN